MKDKEMIEEMAKIISNARDTYFGTDAGKDGYYTPVGHYAKVLLEQGYRKIDKDSVVLSREEYEKKKTHLQNVLELSNSQFEKVVKENESLERLLSLIDDIPKENLLDVDKAIETIKAKERKETAEKILKRIKEIYTIDTGWTDWYDDSFFGAEYKKLAKQFGVEIKE